jgi:membrane-bound lytic murein transglycosylase B
MALRRFAASLVCALAVLAAMPSAKADAAFEDFLKSVWPDAQRLGVSRATFDAATRNLSPDLSLPDLVVPGKPEAPARGQAEFVQTPAEYLRESTFNNLAAQGRKLLAEHRATLEKIERQFGVPGPVILAIWGRETAFGTYKLPKDAVQVLATQAYTGKRKDYFRNQVLDVLKMLQDGVPREKLRASWGAPWG